MTDDAKGRRATSMEACCKKRNYKSKLRACEAMYWQRAMKGVKISSLYRCNHGKHYHLSSMYPRKLSSTCAMLSRAVLDYIEQGYPANLCLLRRYLESHLKIWHLHAPKSARD